MFRSFSAPVLGALSGKLDAHRLFGVAFDG
jgi:hypothetical protein